MITYDEVLNLNYYVKTSYTGWFAPIRFKIVREENPEGGYQFHAWVWPGPMAFAQANPATMLEYTTIFSEEGKRKVVDWINEKHDTYKDIWSSKLI